MANAGGQQGLQEYLDNDEPMAHDDAALIVSQSTASQGVKRGRGGAESDAAEGSKRRRQADHKQDSQAPDPPADDKTEEQLSQDELARRAEDMLVEFKQAATSNAARWKWDAPSAQQKDTFSKLVGQAKQLVKRAFPAAAAGLPLDKVPAEQRHVIVLLRQARDATRQAYVAYDLWRDEAQYRLETVTIEASRAACAWRLTAPTQAQVSLLRMRADALWELVQKVFPAAAAGLPAAQVPEWEAHAVKSIPRAKTLVERALSLAEVWQVPARQEESEDVEMQDATSAQPDTAFAAAARPQAAAAAGSLQPAATGPDAAAAPVCHLSAAELAQHEAYEAARAAAAEAACRAVWRRALAAASEWEHEVPTLQQALDLKQEVESAKLLAWDIWGFAASQRPIIAWLSGALKQALDTAAETALCHVPKQVSVVTFCGDRPPTREQMEELEATYRAARALIAATPEPSVHHALAREANAALAKARKARQRAEEWLAAQAALIAARDHALAAAALWKDGPASSEERDALDAEIREAQDMLDALPAWGLRGLDSLWKEVQKAREEAWIAAEAGMAAMAERRQAAQRALAAFTQQALLLRADWARKGRECLPEREKYLALKQQGREARELARQAFPEAYAYVQQCLREPGTEPDDVPEEEEHAITLIEEARGAWESVMDIWKAWEYVSTVATAAAAA